MKYMLLMYADESVLQKYITEDYKTAQQAWAVWGAEADAAGVFESTSGLSPVSNATTVRIRDGKTLTTDGPFAETHEQLGGCFLLNCKDLDEALSWAAK